MEQECVGPRAMVNRVEYIRLLEQALYRLGYPAIARQLEEVSVRLHPLSFLWNPALKGLCYLSSGRAPPAKMFL